MVVWTHILIFLITITLRIEIPVEAAEWQSSEMLVVSYQDIKCHNSEDQYMNNRVDQTTTYCKIDQDCEDRINEHAGVSMLLDENMFQK
jgi:hypothetical protein